MQISGSDPHIGETQPHCSFLWISWIRPRLRKPAQGSKRAVAIHPTGLEFPSHIIPTVLLHLHPGEQRSKAIAFKEFSSGD